MKVMRKWQTLANRIYCLWLNHDVMDSWTFVIWLCGKKIVQFDGIWVVDQNFLSWTEPSIDPSTGILQRNIIFFHWVEWISFSFKICCSFVLFSFNTLVFNSSVIEEWLPHGVNDLQDMHSFWLWVVFAQLNKSYHISNLVTSII